MLSQFLLLTLLSLFIVPEFCQVSSSSKCEPLNCASLCCTKTQECAKHFGDKECYYTTCYENSDCTSLCCYHNNCMKENECNKYRTRGGYFFWSMIFLFAITTYMIGSTCVFFFCCRTRVERYNPFNALFCVFFVGLPKDGEQGDEKQEN
eukprot:TRINITY_DN1032_c0_g1_i5.p1 TRINITY_DN1032_c0_g1~~TRINITY_DN1032_c0_g1_i5.p1  ORF type:complete len:150 (+),score=17.90 TRINITY_DN1032_c0_g1_i5:105-554(+)